MIRRQICNGLPNRVLQTGPEPDRQFARPHQGACETGDRRRSDNPRTDRSKELTGHPTFFRLWLGRDYRLVWHVLENEQIVEIEYVGPKAPDLYDRLGLTRPPAI